MFLLKKSVCLLVLLLEILSRGESKPFILLIMFLCIPVIYSEISVLSALSVILSGISCLIIVYLSKQYIDTISKMIYWILLGPLIIGSLISFSMAHFLKVNINNGFLFILIVVLCWAFSALFFENNKIKAVMSLFRTILVTLLGSTFLLIIQTLAYQFHNL